MATSADFVDLDFPSGAQSFGGLPMPLFSYALGSKFAQFVSMDQHTLCNSLLTCFACPSDNGDVGGLSRE